MAGTATGETEHIFGQVSADPDRSNACPRGGAASHRKTISNLERSVQNKVVVGVLGRSGAGKSSLINAILQERHLLPAGTVSACTSAVIKVEASTDSQYTAEIHLIRSEEWREELHTLLEILSDEDEDSDMAEMAKEKIQAVYGEDGLGKSFDDLMCCDEEISKFLSQPLKTISHTTASELSTEIGQYTRSDDPSNRSYWPLVKHITIKVPKHQDILEHVVLVDLPGAGDCNKSRDEMWKLYISKCSYVWIVSDIDRAASDKDSWMILNNSIQDMRQGGECRGITFICTKTDNVIPLSYMRCYTGMVTKRFYAGEDTFEVYTVSSEEFQNEENPILESSETEIPQLQKLLKKLNRDFLKKADDFYARKDGRGYHKTLKALCWNEGFFRSKNGIVTDLNKTLATVMFEHVDDLFQSIFPVDGSTGGSINKRIDDFSIVPNKKFSNLSVQLYQEFFETEEDVLKQQLKSEVLERKKKIYASLTESIKTSMSACYKEAAAFSGPGSMKLIQETLQHHIESTKHIMFHKAKKNMLELFKSLKV
ncbi:nuclear GTPase SLIP-GC-like [Megalops cyprinoides]|uniref:nuclear GTPase SLIP-GC-like n=1 Tax=Megalops cyprinoides TaxID=118141 RepID=UPI001864709A|nr:nuclear GTPase SLIP-GC-like [Megalops cyprinoides]